MDTFDQLRTVAISLALVLACLFLLSFVAKKVRGRAGQTLDQRCEIISSTYVGPKERILLMRVRDKEVLIGVGPSHMCALGEFDVAAINQHQPKVVL